MFDPVCYKYLRKYLKIQDVFGNVKGFVEFFVFIISFVSVYTDYRLEYYLFNELVNVKVNGTCRKFGDFSFGDIKSNLNLNLNLQQRVNKNKIEAGSICFAEANKLENFSLDSACKSEKQDFMGNGENPIREIESDLSKRFKINSNANNNRSNKDIERINFHNKDSNENKNLNEIDNSSLKNLSIFNNKKAKQSNLNNFDVSSNNKLNSLYKNKFSDRSFNNLMHKDVYSAKENKNAINRNSNNNKNILLKFGDLLEAKKKYFDPSFFDYFYVKLAFLFNSNNSNKNKTKKYFDFKLLELFNDKIKRKFDVFYYLNMIRKLKFLKQYALKDKISPKAFNAIAENFYVIKISDFNDDSIFQAKEKTKINRDMLWNILMIIVYQLIIK